MDGINKHEWDMAHTDVKEQGMVSQDQEQDIEAKVREKIAELYPKKKAELLTLAEEVAWKHNVRGCTERDSRRVILTFLTFAYSRELQGKSVAV